MGHTDCHTTGHWSPHTHTHNPYSPASIPWISGSGRQTEANTRPSTQTIVGVGSPSALVSGHFVVFSKVRLVFKPPSLDDKSSTGGVAFFPSDFCQDQKQLEPFLLLSTHGEPPRSPRPRCHPRNARDQGGWGGLRRSAHARTLRLSLPAVIDPKCCIAHKCHPSSFHC